MSTPRKFITSTFALTREEKILLATVLAIALTGLVARYFYLHVRKPDAYQPAGANATPAKTTPRQPAGGPGQE